MDQTVNGSKIIPMRSGDSGITGFDGALKRLLTHARKKLRRRYSGLIYKPGMVPIAQNDEQRLIAQPALLGPVFSVEKSCPITCGYRTSQGFFAQTLERSGSNSHIEN